jgi:hypothetical protein
MRGVATDAPALVRIDLAGKTDLSKLALLDLSIYVQLSTPQGGIAVLLPADSRLQGMLAGRGFAVQVLDPDAAGATYYLLYGLPETLRQAVPATRLLMMDGRQAVVRAQPAEADRIAALGVRIRPLQLSRLIAPRPEKIVSFPESALPDPLIQTMINQVDGDALFNMVGGLSGEWPVTVNGSPYTFSTRYTYADTSIQKATRYAYEHFQALGLPVDYDTYTLSGEKRNVVAEQTGVSQPGRIFVIVAHLDSYSTDPYNRAPGADDNASGSTSVLAAADILSQYEFGCTLRYLLVTGEEQGLVGSKAYAADAYARGDDIEGVLDLDMIAYNTPGSSETIELHTRPSNASDLAIANLFANTITTYSLGLTSSILQDAAGGSDHASFWYYYYPAIMAIEDWDDHTPSYHKITDKLSTLSKPYFTKFVKAAVGTFAQMGCLQEGKITGTVTDALSGELLSGAVVEARKDAQRAWSTTTNPDGTYQLALSTGNYDVTASAFSHLSQTTQNVQIANTETKTLDFSLQPCSVIQNISFAYGPAWPATSETVTFTATPGGFSQSVYHWDFGDGNSDTGQVATHSYSTRGAYQVKLTISGACPPADAYQTVPVQLNIEFLPLVIR